LKGTLGAVKFHGVGDNIEKNAVNKATILLIIVLLLIVSFSGSGCTRPEPYEYSGEYPELYSIAINSVLGSTGYSLSEKKFDPDITVMDKDMYGRKLFLYTEYKGISTYNLIVSQKDDDQYAYFYPDYNFISASEDNFSTNEIEMLKEKNDWGKATDLTKCIKVKIVRQKDTGPVPNNKLMQLYKEALGSDSRRIENTYFFIKDDFGRSIYLGYGTGERYVVMLFNSDGSYDESKCLLELTDIYNYQDALKLFKEQNGWNMPV